MIGKLCEDDDGTVCISITVGCVGREGNEGDLEDGNDASEAENTVVKSRALEIGFGTSFVLPRVRIEE